MAIENPNSWVLRFTQSSTAENIGALFLPIPEFDTPDLSDALLRIEISSSTAKASWSRAGSISQMVNAGGVEAVASIIFPRLNRPQLWELNPDFPTYQLRVSYPKYFSQAQINIYAFSG